MRLSQDPLVVLKCGIITENTLLGDCTLPRKQRSQLLPCPTSVVGIQCRAGICRASPAVGQPSQLMTLELGLNPLFTENFTPFYFHFELEPNVRVPV